MWARLVASMYLLVTAGVAAAEPLLFQALTALRKAALRRVSAAQSGDVAP